MSNDRQTAPIEKVDGAVKASSLTPAPPDAPHSPHGARAEPVAPARLAPLAPSTPLPTPVSSPLRDGRDGAAARRRHALRIPDDEISRPQLAGTGARSGAPPSEPAIQSDPGPVVTPTRIITISEPPPPVGEADQSEPSLPGGLALGAFAPEPTPLPDSATHADLSGLEDGEVEVRFDDDLPFALVPPVAPAPARPLIVELEWTPEPPRSPLEAVRTSTEAPSVAAEPDRVPAGPGSAPVESTCAPAEPVRAPAEPSQAPEPTRGMGEPDRAPAEPARALADPPRPMDPARAPADPLCVTTAEPVRAAPEAAGVAAEPPRAPPEPVRTAVEAPRAVELPRVVEEPGETREEVEFPIDLERVHHPSDLPEIAAEDMVTLEPPPVRPMSASPPVRPRATSQPASATTGSVSAPKPPRIPTPRSSLVIVPPHVGTVPSQQTDGAAPRRKVRLWWEELFNDDYLRATEKVADEQLSHEVAFIEESLGVERGGALLDLACGTGRHAIELARRGYEVVGFDLSLAMLARAGDEAQDLGAKLNFVQGDMREMTFEEQFDGIYCWSTSFGYFEEEKNAQVIARIRRALKAGGTFLLDVANRDFLVRQSPSLAWFEGDGCVCMDEMNLDFITSRMKVKRTMMLDDGRSREIEYSMRVYSLHELGKILHDHGFKVREVSGRLATPGVFFGSESPRAIILAEKK